MVDDDDEGRMRFHIETFGCTANYGNSQEAEALLVEMGHVASSIERAEMVIVNTCAVTARTERKVLKRLGQLQGDRLVVAGCLPAGIPDAVAEISCRKSVGILNMESVVEIADTMTKRPENGHIEGFRQKGHLCGIVNISEGCVGKCSYCLVRKARGNLVSRDEEEIEEMVRRLVRSGVVEIQLAAQDASAYGMDIGSSLPDLLHRIGRIQGRHMIRVGMTNPDTLEPVLDDIVRELRGPRIYRFLHIPLQSGSGKVLRDMNRGYTPETYLHVVSTLKESVPDITINTDVIAGFPGESEEDFAATVSLLRKMDPDKVNVTRYSRRPGTPVMDLEEVLERVKKERSRVLTRLWQDIAAHRNRRYLGRVLEVLVTESGKGMTVKARSGNYKDVVVGGTPALGTLHKVMVVRYNPFYLEGAIHTGDNINTYI